MCQMTGDKSDKSIVPFLPSLFELESDWFGRVSFIWWHKFTHLFHSVFCDLHTFLITSRGLTFKSWSIVVFDCKIGHLSSSIVILTLLFSFLIHRRIKLLNHFLSLTLLIILSSVSLYADGPLNSSWEVLASQLLAFLTSVVYLFFLHHTLGLTSLQIASPLKSHFLIHYCLNIGLFALVAPLQLFDLTEMTDPLTSSHYPSINLLLSSFPSWSNLDSTASHYSSCTNILNSLALSQILLPHPVLVEPNLSPFPWLLPNN